MIHTAGCIIIGDEVLGGKVKTIQFPGHCGTLLTQLAMADGGYKLRSFRQVLLPSGYES